MFFKHTPFKSTFNLPNTNERYLKGNSRGYGVESLPNITGTITSWHDSDTDRTDFSAISGKVTGAFTKRGGYRNRAVPEPNITVDNNAACTMLGFDASSSSLIYQDGAKVNPDHIYMNFIIKY